MLGVKVLGVQHMVEVAMEWCGPLVRADGLSDAARYECAEAVRFRFGVLRLGTRCK